jgi:hypothetical protein
MIGGCAIAEQKGGEAHMCRGSAVSPGALCIALQCWCIWHSRAVLVHNTIQPRLVRSMHVH